MLVLVGVGRSLRSVVGLGEVLLVLWLFKYGREQLIY